MITHVLRLTRGEWYKLRRRRIPWMLLGIIAAITQGVFWLGYVSYHLGADSVAAAGTAAAPESREGVSVSAGLVAGGAGADGFILPFSINRRTEQLPMIFVIPIMILTATVIGVEYGLGTLRATLTRGAGRWQLLSAKFVMLMVAGSAGIIVIAALVGIASIVAGVLPPAGEEPLVVGNAAAWKAVATALGKAVYALAPYVALAVFLTVATRSNAQGLALSMGYFLFELLIAPALAGIAVWLGNVLDVTLLGSNVSEWMSAAFPTDSARAFFVILAYTAVLLGAALWIFQRRDVPGAKGE
jgi:ABC-type transport system involved in multi-copper enzyme maturation permease subunit